MFKLYDTNDDTKSINPFLYLDDRASFVYFDTNDPIQSPEQERIARLTSRTIDGRSSQHCVQLDYAFPQNSSSRLTIAVVRNDGKQSNVLTLFGSAGGVDGEQTDGGSWRNASTTLNKEMVGERFQVSWTQDMIGWTLDMRGWTLDIVGWTPDMIG